MSNQWSCRGIHQIRIGSQFVSMKSRFASSREGTSIAGRSILEMSWKILECPIYKWMITGGTPMTFDDSGKLQINGTRNGLDVTLVWGWIETFYSHRQTNRSTGFPHELLPWHLHISTWDQNAHEMFMKYLHMTTWEDILPLFLVLLFPDYFQLFLLCFPIWSLLFPY